MPLDVATWVKGLELPEAEQKVVLDAITKGGDKAIKYLEANQLHQTEFTRLQTDIRAKEADLAKKIEQEDRFRDSLVTWDKKSKQELADAKAARETAERALTAAREKVGTLATQYEIPTEEVSKLFEGAPVVTANHTPNNTGVDTKELDGRYVTVDTFRNEARAYARFAAMIPTLERQYYRLFGDSAETPNWEKLIEKTVATNGAQTIQQVFETEYKIPEKREELRNASHQAEVDKARREGAEAERAKILADNPAAAVAARANEREGSPVLSLARKQAEDANKGKPVIVTQSPVAAAVAAFNQGKYKTGEKAA